MLRRIVLCTAVLCVAGLVAADPEIITDDENMLFIVDADKKVGYRQGNVAPAVLFDDLATTLSVQELSTAVEAKYFTKTEADAYASQVTADQERQNGNTKQLSTTIDILSGRVTQTETKLSAAETKLSAVEAKAAKVDVLAKQISDLNVALKGQEAQARQELTSATRPLSQQVTKQETDLKAALAKIAALEAKIAKGPSVSTSGTCSSDNVGTLRLDAKTNSLQVCVKRDNKYVFEATANAGKLPPKSCKEVKAQQPGAATGTYTIKDANGQDMTVWCEMSADGGGWTLIAYGGTIHGSKRNTLARVGQYSSTSHYQLLFDTFGPYNANAPKNRVAFSRMHDSRLRHIVLDSSRVLSMRTGDRNRQMIWTITSKLRYRRGSSIPDVTKLRLTRNGRDYGEYGPVNVFQRGCTIPCYTGWDLNMCGASLGCGSSNCDNCYGWSQKRISHRALLYWETGDSGYAATQWFHADPLTIDRSGDPRNTKHDIGFYVRE